MRTPIGLKIDYPARRISAGDIKPLLTCQAVNSYPLLDRKDADSGPQTRRNHPALTGSRDAEKLLAQHEQ